MNKKKMKTTPIGMKESASAQTGDINGQAGEQQPRGSQVPQGEQEFQGSWQQRSQEQQFQSSWQQQRSRDQEFQGPHQSQDRPQKFIKNDRYFTITIYAFLLVVVSTIAIKAIVSFGTTKKFIGQIFRAIAPFLIALLIAYLLMPFVKAAGILLRKVFKHISDRACTIISLLIVYTAAVGLVVLLLIYILPEVVENIGQLIGMIPKAYEELTAFIGWLQKRFPDVDMKPITDMLQSTQGDLTGLLSNISGKLVPVLYTASVSIVTWIGNFLIAFIVSIYMLYGRKSLLRIIKIALYALVPKKHIGTVVQVLIDCNHIFSAFLVSKMIDSLIIGILCGVLMTILRLPYVFLISTFVGVTNMIPYFGPVIGAIPGIVIILVESPVKALVFLIMILALQQFDGWYLGPKLMGNAMNLKAIWIIFAITIGGKAFGPIGMFLGVPFTAMLAYLLERYMRYRLKRKNMDYDEIQ